MRMLVHHIEKGIRSFDEKARSAEFVTQFISDYGDHPPLINSSLVRFQRPVQVKLIAALWICSEVTAVIELTRFKSDEILEQFIAQFIEHLLVSAPCLINRSEGRHKFDHASNRGYYLKLDLRAQPDDVTDRVISAL